MLFNIFKKKKSEEDILNEKLIHQKNLIKCKCCGNNTAEYFGSVDFNKNCEEHKGILKLEPKDIDIEYHKCKACGFLFTASFDDFTPDDWGTYIYNDDYIQVDPDYTGARSNNFSKLIMQMFPNEEKPEMLDFGGGKGVLADILNKNGFKMDTYDPYSDINNTKPDQKYKMIFSFEVVEHSPNPIETFNEIFECLDDNGVFVFSTLLQPQPFQGLSWWYAGPRNGHISLHTPQSLAHCIQNKKGYVIAPFGQGLHIMFKPENRPEFSNPWFNKK